MHFAPKQQDFCLFPSYQLIILAITSFTLHYQVRTSQSTFQHKTPIVAVESVSFDDKELMVTGSVDGHIQGHIHHEGLLETVFKTKLPPTLFERLEILKVLGISPTLAIASCIGKGKKAKTNCIFSTLIIKKTEDGKIQTTHHQSHSSDSHCKLAKLFTAAKDVALLVTEVGQHGNCSLNIYTLCSAALAMRAPSSQMMKFRIKESIPLTDWVLDFSWIEQNITIAFCNSTIQTIPVSMKNHLKQQNDIAFTDYRRKLIFVGSETEVEEGYKEMVATSDIVAYDKHHEVIIIATADNEVQFWCNSALRGTISVNAKVTDLSICKSPPRDTDEPNEMFVAIGSQHGELLIIKWIWSDEQKMKER